MFSQEKPVIRRDAKCSVTRKLVSVGNCNISDIQTSYTSQPLCKTVHNNMVLDLTWNRVGLKWLFTTPFHI